MGEIALFKYILTPPTLKRGPRGPKNSTFSTVLACEGGKLCMYHTKSHNAFNTHESKTKKTVKETILFMFHNPRLELRIIGKLFFVHVSAISTHMKKFLTYTWLLPAWKNQNLIDT